MSSTRQIKSRIRSVSSNKQITKAMELVAASKLRRAQESAIQTSRFTLTAIELLSALSAITDVYDHPFFVQRPIKARLYVLITSDRGLAGAYNNNILKKFSERISRDHADSIVTRVICMGQKGAQYAAKLKNVRVDSVYRLPDMANAASVRPILTAITNEYRQGAVEAVTLISTHFKNSFVQVPAVHTLLPAGFRDVDAPSAISAALFEPSPDEVLDYATVRLVEAQLFQALLDALASEHAMRRVAMKNASDNAGDIIDALTLEMNKVRQASITQELSEISAGVEAMK